VVEAADTVGPSRSMIYRFMHETPHPFPPPVEVGGASLWVEQEVWPGRAGRSLGGDSGAILGGGRIVAV
jgi:hypothetical protein